MASSPILQSKADTSADKVGTVELFFDLVFVFAVTQLSHELLLDLSWTGTGHAAILLAAIWWLWVLTTWATNALNTESSAVRLLLFAMMIGALTLSTSISGAFDDKGLAFAAAYVAVQIGRTAFVWFAHRADDERKGHFARMGLWLVVSGLFWVGGAIMEGSYQVGLWVAALVIDYTSAAAGFWVPGVGRSPSTQVDVEEVHLAERVGLFLIIALGESILVTGQTFAEADWTRTSIAAVLAAVIGSVAMWWIYFGKHADVAVEVVGHADNPGRIARSAYTYTPLVIVAGIMITAVGDELAIAHTDGAVDLPTALALLGGPALFLAGTMMFKWEIFRRLAIPRLTGIGVLIALVFTVPWVTPLWLALLSTGVLVAVAVWEAFGGAKVMQTPQEVDVRS